MLACVSQWRYERKDTFISEMQASYQHKFYKAEVINEISQGT